MNLKYKTCAAFSGLEKMSHKVNFRDFDASKLVFGKVEEATSNPNGGGKKITYYRIKIQYNYDIKTDDGRIVQTRDDLYIEGPTELSRGPQSKTYEDDENGGGSAEGGKVVHSVLSRYDMSNLDHYDYVNSTDGTIQRLYDACVKYVFDNRGDVNITSRSIDGMMDLFWYPCIKWKKEKGVVVPGANPNGIWKLFRYGKEPRIYETKFYLPLGDKGGRVVPWESIKDNNINHIPLIRVNNITVASGRPSLKIEMHSSVITKILPGEGPSIQLDTIEKLKTDTSNLDLESLQAKIAELENQLKSVKAISNDTQNSSSDNTSSSAPMVPIVIPGINMQTSPPSPTPPAKPAAEPAPTIADMVKTPEPVTSGGLPLPPIPGLSIPGLKIGLP